MRDIYDVAEAFQVWSSAPPHEQHVRTLALNALASLAPTMLTEARDLARDPHTWAQSWRLLDPSGAAPPWVVAAVCLDRDLVTWQPTPPAGWLLGGSLQLAADDPPQPPQPDRIHIIGAVRWRAELATYERAALQWAAHAPSVVYNAASDNQIVDLALQWAAATLTACVVTPTGPDAPRVMRALRRGDRRPVCKFAARLGLQEPPGKQPGGRPPRDT